MSTTPRSKPVPHAQSARLPALNSPRGFKGPTLLSVQRHTPSNREVLLGYHNDLTKLATLEKEGEQTRQSAKALTTFSAPSAPAEPMNSSSSQHHNAHSVRFNFEAVDPSIEPSISKSPIERTNTNKPTRANPFPEKQLTSEYDEIKQRIEAYEARYQRGNLQRRMTTLFNKSPAALASEGGTSSPQNPLTSETLQKAFDELKFSFLDKVVLEKEEEKVKSEDLLKQKQQAEAKKAQEAKVKLVAALHADRLRRFLLPKYQQAVKHHIGAARDEQTRSAWMPEAAASLPSEPAVPVFGRQNTDNQKHKRSVNELINWLCQAALEGIERPKAGTGPRNAANAGSQLFKCFELCTDLCNFVLCKVLPSDVFAGDGDRYQELVRAALRELEGPDSTDGLVSTTSAIVGPTGEALSSTSSKNVLSSTTDDNQQFFLTRVPKPPSVCATPADPEKKLSTRMRAERALAGVAKARLQELVPTSKNENFTPDGDATDAKGSARKRVKHLSSINQTLQAAADRHGLWLSLCSPRLAHPPLHACSHLDGRRLRDEQKYHRQVVAITGGQPPSMATASVGTETSAEAKSKATVDHIAHNAVTDIEDFHKPDDTILPIVELLQDMATAMEDPEGHGRGRAVVGRQTGAVEGALLAEIAACYCSFVKAIADPELRAPKSVEDIKASDANVDSTETPRCVFAKRHMIVATAPRLLIDATINYLRTLTKLPTVEEERVERRHRKLLEYSITGEFRDPALVDADVETEISLSGRRGHSNHKLGGSDDGKEAALKRLQAATAAAATSQQEKERMEMLAKEQNSQLLSEILIRLRGELLFLFTGVDERQHFIEEHQRKERQRWEALDARRRQRQQQQHAKQLALANSKKGDLLGSTQASKDNSPAPSHRSAATASNKSSKDAAIQPPTPQRGRRGSFMSGPTVSGIAMLMDDLHREDEEAVAAMMLMGAKCGGVSVTGVSELTHQAQLRQHKQKLAEKENAGITVTAPASERGDEGAGIRIVIEPSVNDLEFEAPTGVFPLPPKAAIFDWQNSHRAISPPHHGGGPKSTKPEVGSHTAFMKPTASSANNTLINPQLQKHLHASKLPEHPALFGSSALLTTGAYSGKGRSPSILGHSASSYALNPFTVTRRDEEAEMQGIANDLLQLERHRRRHNPTLLLQHPTIEAAMLASSAPPTGKGEGEEADSMAAMLGEDNTIIGQEAPKRPPPMPSTFDKELSPEEVETVRKLMMLSAREMTAMDKGAAAEMNKLQSPKGPKKDAGEEEAQLAEGVGPILGRYQYHAKEGCYYFPLSTGTVKVDPKTGEQAKVVKLVSVTQSVVGVKEAEAVERFKQACKQTLPGSDVMTRWYEHKSSDGAFRKYKDERKDAITIEAEKHLTNAAQPSGSTNTLQRGTFDVHGVSPLTVLWNLANDQGKGPGTWRGKPLSINWTF